MAGGEQLPFSWISDLPPRAQQEIWRDFQSLSDRISGVTGPVVFVAASDATESERAAANFRCDGHDDQVEINLALLMSPLVQLSSGSFHVSGSIGDGANRASYVIFGASADPTAGAATVGAILTTVVMDSGGTYRNDALYCATGASGTIIYGYVTLRNVKSVTMDYWPNYLVSGNGVVLHDSIVGGAGTTAWDAVVRQATNLSDAVIANNCTIKAVELVVAQSSMSPGGWRGRVYLHGCDTNASYSGLGGTFINTAFTNTVLQTIVGYDSAFYDPCLVKMLECTGVNVSVAGLLDIQSCQLTRTTGSADSTIVEAYSPGSIVQNNVLLKGWNGATSYFVIVNGATHHVSANARIVNNVFRLSGIGVPSNYAVKVVAGATGTLVHGNDAYGAYSTGLISDAGTGTRTEPTPSGLAEHLADTVDAHHASAIGVTPVGSLVALDVQSALAELDSLVDGGTP